MSKKGILQVVEELVWEDIARDLIRPGTKAACLGEKSEFREYLIKNLSSSLKVLSTSDRGSYDLIVGWQAASARALKLCYRALRAGGAADLYGFYSQPSAEDVINWERRLRSKSPGGTLPLPLPRAVSLSRVAAWLKDSSFNHYNLSKKGIYYRLRLLR